MADVNPRNSNALPPPVKVQKFDADGIRIQSPPTPKRIGEDFATFQEAGFKSESEMESFRRGFLIDYIRFTLLIIEKILPVMA